MIISTNVVSLTYQSNKGTNNQSITQYLKRGIGIKKGGNMKIVLRVSLREAGRASEAINDNWHLKKGFNQVETNVWEADSEFWGDLEDEDNVDELKFLVENQFGFLGISEDEYEFNEEEE